MNALYVYIYQLVILQNLVTFMSDYQPLKINLKIINQLNQFNFS